jgi:hypothetical protein
MLPGNGEEFVKVFHGGHRPGKKHRRGVSDKEQRQYEHLKEDAEKSGRYGDRAEEVAARTVMKQHAKHGHKKGEGALGVGRQALGVSV